MDDPAQLVVAARKTARLARSQAADRDDLAQETLLRVWRRLLEDRRAGTAGGLIRTTLRRVRIDWWRRDRRVDGRAAEAVCRHGPLDDAALAELRAAVRRAVAALPPPQREVVRLRLKEGRKFREIAAVQQVPLNTVLGRMHLAVRRLRAELEAHVDGVPGER